MQENAVTIEEEDVAIDVLIVCNTKTHYRRRCSHRRNQDDAGESEDRPGAYTRCETAD